MKKGATGASLGGSVVHTRKPNPREKNTAPCASCGAGKGEPCFKNVPGRGLRTLSRTHRSQARVKGPRSRAGHVEKAHQIPDGLGPLIPVRPTRLRPDRSPRLAAGQVYVMRSGTIFHSAWCSIVAAKWDNDPEGLLLIAADTVGGRRECTSCENPLTS